MLLFLLIKALVMQHRWKITACQFANSSDEQWGFVFYESPKHTGFKKVTLLAQLLKNLLRCRPTFWGLREILLGLRLSSSGEVGGVGRRT